MHELPQAKYGLDGRPLKKADQSHLFNFKRKDFIVIFSIIGAVIGKLYTSKKTKLVNRISSSVSYTGISP